MKSMQLFVLTAAITICVIASSNNEHEKKDFLKIIPQRILKSEKVSKVESSKLSKSKSMKIEKIEKSKDMKSKKTKDYRMWSR